jgi:hypothetical protein
LAGNKAFYQWCGLNPAIVSMKRLGALGWALDEVKHPRNRNPSAASLEAIQGELEGMGCIPDPGVEDSLTRLGLWGIAA